MDEVVETLYDGDEPGGAIANPSYITRRLNRARQQLRPDDPQDLLFDVENLQFPPGFLRTDVQVQGER